MFDRAVEDAESRYGIDRKFPDIVALGRWVNSALGVLGALALGVYLLTATPDATPPAPLAVGQVVPPAPAPAPAPAQLTLSSDNSFLTHSNAARDDSTRTSTRNPLKAVFGAVLAFAWVMFGAWLSARSVRALRLGQGQVHTDEDRSGAGRSSSLSVPSAGGSK